MSNPVLMPIHSTVMPACVYSYLPCLHALNDVFFHADASSDLSTVYTIVNKRLCPALL